MRSMGFECKPKPGYVPKVLSTSFRSQVVTLHSFHPPPFASSEDERLHMRITPRFGEKPPSYWCVLVLAAAGLPRQSRGFPTG